MIDVDFSKQEIFTPVYSNKYGKGVIVDINIEKYQSFPVTVMFDHPVKNGKPFIHYSKRGTEGPFSFYPTLFLEKQEIPKEAYQEPMPRISKDTLIQVLEKNKWVRRYFKEWKNTSAVCYSDGGNSLTTNKCQTYMEFKL